MTAQGEPHPRLTRAHAAQGGVTLGLEQGEPGAVFCHLGRNSQTLNSLQFVEASFAAFLDIAFHNTQQSSTSASSND
jgi:hypothetical protein